MVDAAINQAVFLPLLCHPLHRRVRVNFRGVYHRKLPSRFRFRQREIYAAQGFGLLAHPCVRNPVIAAVNLYQDASGDKILRACVVDAPDGGAPGQVNVCRERSACCLDVFPARYLNFGVALVSVHALGGKRLIARRVVPILCKFQFNFLQQLFAGGVVQRWVCLCPCCGVHDLAVVVQTTNKIQPAVVRLAAIQHPRRFFHVAVKGAVSDVAVRRYKRAAGVRALAQTCDRHSYQFVVLVGVDFVKINFAGSAAVLCFGGFCVILDL